MSRRTLWRKFIPGLAAVAVLALILSIVVVRQLRGHEEEGDNAAAEMRDALEHNPALSQRQLPLAYLSEKVAQGVAGSEASGETLSGPSQEEYDNRAFPHTQIAPAQQLADANAYLRAASRAGTPEGQQVLRAAVKSAPVAMPCRLRARPKSVTLSCSRELSRRLVGRRSRCRTPHSS